MFGLEILDIVIGLTFIYLLLSLMATAIHEYISALLNKRGKELAKGIARLLDDIDGNEAVALASNAVGDKPLAKPTKLVEQFYSHRLIRPLATRTGVWGKITGGGDPRLPSYIPARSFALALLDILGYQHPDAPKPGADEGTKPKTSTHDGVRTTEGASSEAPKPTSPADPEQAAQLVALLELLKRESPLDVTEHLGGLQEFLKTPALDPNVRAQIVGAVASAQTPLQKLHDSTEVWFNNSMDRVSGAYKRYTQGALLVIGLIIAILLNADTIQMWKRLAENDALRTAMADRAARLLPALDTIVNATPGDTMTKVPVPAPGGQPTGTDSASAGSAPRGAQANAPAAPADSAPPLPGAAAPKTTAATPDTAKAPTPDSAAKLKYLATRAMLDSMELKLGWTREDWAYLGFKSKKTGADSTAGNAASAKLVSGAADTRTAKSAPSNDSVAPPAEAVSGTTYAGRWLAKFFGLLMTGLAISLGAPFWFDMLNKVISVRAAGRSPAERPKSPEGESKRAGEQAPR